MNSSMEQTEEHQNGQLKQPTATRSSARNNVLISTQKKRVMTVKLKS